MINKFATVYAGHIDFPDHGQNATPANERRFSNEQLAGVFDKTEAIAKQMDALGYDTLWLAEHHFQHEGYECIPNILMLRGAPRASDEAAARSAAASTSRRCGTRCAWPRISPPPTS